MDAARVGGSRARPFPRPLPRRATTPAPARRDDRTNENRSRAFAPIARSIDALDARDEIRRDRSTLDGRFARRDATRRTRRIGGGVVERARGPSTVRASSHDSIGASIGDDRHRARVARVARARLSRVAVFRRRRRVVERARARGRARRRRRREKKRARGGVLSMYVFHVYLVVLY